ncbi:MAG: prolyl oligopeptidase family serine peptidase [Bacteroidota bacterium]|nr:prolyl oligopeptidase family serine peptidase [Bacteroidota bacterium]
MKWRTILFSGMLMSLAVVVLAQKPVLDTGALAKWPMVENAMLSPDGRFAAYAVRTFGGAFDSRVIHVKATFSDWNKTFSGVEGVEFTQDGRRAIFLRKDTLNFVTLGSDEEEFIPNVSSYSLYKAGDQEYLLYYSKTGRQLTIVGNGNKESLNNVDAWLLSPDGSTLAKKTNIDAGNQTISRIDLKTKAEKVIWSGTPVYGWQINDSGTQLVFSAKDQTGQNQIWYYKAGGERAIAIAGNQRKGFDHRLTIGNLLNFSRDGKRLFFNLRRQLPKPDPNKISVDVWSYRDAVLQSQQLQEYTPEHNYLAIVSLDDGYRVTRLQMDSDYSRTISPDGNYVIFDLAPGDKYEINWSTPKQCRYDLVDTRTGKRNTIKKYGFLGFSPSGRFVQLLDYQTGDWSTYELATGIIRPLTAEVPVSNTKGDDEAGDLKRRGSIDLKGWLPGDRGVLVADYYDLWELDPLGKNPVISLTLSEGSKEKITFTPAVKNPGRVVTDDTLILSGFDHSNKDNGFYRIRLHHQQSPERLTMGPYAYYAPSSGLGEPVIKSGTGAVYLVQREDINATPNYFVTMDFKSFKPISQIYPERRYNWVQSKLINFKTLGGRSEQGVLFLPEDFDPHKKYPVIFHYYELKSDLLHQYHIPDIVGRDLDVSWFCSHGYLVFTPDFHYVLGKPGQSVLKTTVGAVRLLKTFSYVDSKHMGLQGHSYGGWETNYLVTHTDLFAAASCGAGPSDEISGMSSMVYSGTSTPDFAQYGQSRMGATLWEHPDYYIKNSPVFYADKVTTPLLMLSNKKDYGVPFTQGLEFFTALRRLGKKAWILQYDNGTHSVPPGKDATDYLIRTTQFFDHYLKGVPAPKWMVEGIPAAMKQVDNGLELEPAGVEPGPGLLTPEAQKAVDALGHKKAMTIIFK